MYASSIPVSGHNARSNAGVYARVGVETGVNGADPHMLIAMLFDGALESISQARGAIAGGNLEAKGKSIGRAMSIISEGLQGGLRANSNSLASDLSALYGYLITRLVHANVNNDDAALQECSQLLQPIRDAWAQIRSEVVHGASA